MGYYQGDFYRGFRGDPGFFSFLGGLAKSAVGLIPGVGPGLSSLLKGAAKSAPSAAGMATTAIEKVGPAAMMRGAASRIGRGIIKHPVLSAAGAAGAIGATALGVHELRKHEGGKKRRRMNPCNGRALRRAVRRALAFERIAMRTIHLVHPKKKARFGGFRLKRKRAA